MGLDMYLEAEKYLGLDKNDKKIMTKINKLAPCSFSDTPRKIIYDVMYWRKANHIHKWFVDNVQGGEDECKRTYVSKDQMTALRDVCKQVLETAKLVPGKIHISTEYSNGKETKIYEDAEVISNEEDIAELLPTTEGFFFGGTDYNKYYLEDVKNTMEILDKVLNSGDVDEYDFYYRSSW